MNRDEPILYSRMKILSRGRAAYLLPFAIGLFCFRLIPESRNSPLLQRIVLSPNPVFLRQGNAMNLSLAQKGDFRHLRGERFLWQEGSGGRILRLEKPGFVRALNQGQTRLNLCRPSRPGYPLEAQLGVRRRQPWPGEVLLASAEVNVLPARSIPENPRREVVAAYYPWFSERYSPPPPRPRYCEDWTIYTPTIKPYDTQSEEVLEQHIRMAKDGGIDAFAVSWFTFRREYDFSYEELIRPTLEKMAAIAPALDFKVHILYEAPMNLCRFSEGGNWIPLSGAEERQRACEGIEVDFLYLLDRISAAEEHPAIFVYVAADIGLSPQDWLSVLLKVRAKHPQALFYADTYNLNYLLAFDGLFSYGAFLFEPLMDLYSFMSGAVKSYGQGKKFYATVGPGFDATLYWGRHDLFVPREDGATYQHTWQKALEAHPDGVFITSWNEWGETTIIEPSKEYGYQYIELSAANVIVFKKD